MAGRGAAETCKCHHVNRWGSHPSSMETGEGREVRTQEPWREEQLGSRPCCCRMHAGSEVKKETGFCLLLQLSKRPWQLHATERGTGTDPGGSSRVTTTPLSTSRERWSKESLVKFNLFTDVAFSLPLNSAEPFLSSLLWFALGQFCFVFCFKFFYLLIF